eukprot:4864541-Prymnesium_polylepis.1
MRVAAVRKHIIGESEGRDAEWMHPKEGGAFSRAGAQQQGLGWRAPGLGCAVCDAPCAAIHRVDA